MIRTVFSLTINGKSQVKSESLQEIKNQYNNRKSSRYNFGRLGISSYQETYSPLLGEFVEISKTRKDLY